jgi:two-component system response regulator
VNRCVLVVEDNVDDQLLVRWAFRNMPELTIEIAQDGQEGLDYLLAHELDLPVLVMLDLKMPKVNGHELLCGIRARPTMAELPIVVFSSSDEPRDIEEAKRCRATEFVQKPVEFGRYVETITRVVKKYADL